MKKEEGCADGVDEMPRKRSKSLSLSDDLLKKLSLMWYEEMKKHLNRDENISFSEFVEELLWEAVKLRSK